MFIILLLLCVIALLPTRLIIVIIYYWLSMYSSCCLVLLSFYPFNSLLQPTLQMSSMYHLFDAFQLQVLKKINIKVFIFSAGDNNDELLLLWRNARPSSYCIFMK